MSAAVQLQPGVFGLYQARNRVLLSRYGRWAQKDPNASGLVLLTSGSLGSPEPSMIALGTLLTDSANLFSFVGNDPVNKTDPTGLSWRESLEGVLMPIVTVAGGQMGAAAGMLNELLNGYHLMISTHSLVQGAAYDAEDQVDWALDWNSSDFDNPRFGNLGGGPAEPTADSGPGELALAIGNLGRGFPRRAIVQGKWAERASRNANGTVTPTKRYINGVDDSGKEFRRALDGVGTGKPGGIPEGHYMEVKNGNQGPTLKLKRQMDRDRILMRDNPDIKSIKWEFWLRKGQTLNDEIQTELSTRGIQCIVRHYRD